MNKKAQSRLSNQLIHLKQKQFTGQVNIKADNNTWQIYLCLGRLVWADSGIHPNRSWKRLIDKYCPQVDWHNFKLENTERLECGDYSILTSAAWRK